jgi:hypothetical protein
LPTPLLASRLVLGSRPVFYDHFRDDIAPCLISQTPDVCWSVLSCTP